ncbi:class I SAM-dependent methyltransferase [Leminorella grimontii]|uniref:class I SAM-dependent methyltransferase n=1 Tax=Leminorella grimontii TaxID=82981 RepID=UPI002083DB46|nr:class I SAM-dependent methyltransferase [Leminorella grimontii]GKX58716.1 S-adenosyl-L-methionine-dependent methyltransferase Phc [Leminorella grimontii]
MSDKRDHHRLVERQFGEQAGAYLTSAVHAQGADLQKLSRLMQQGQYGRVLDVGCGAGHASFAAAPFAQSVTAYDLSQDMLNAVQKGAADRGLSNVQTQSGIAESLPFEAASFDAVISRYSAHHWQNVGLALCDIHRILKPGGRVVFMDVVSPGHPVLDIYLQTVEALRDRSHVRDYGLGEWSRFINDAGLVLEEITTDRLTLEFKSWTERMRTSQVYVEAIRAYQQEASADVKRHFAIADDGTFTTDIAMFVGRKA